LTFANRAVGPAQFGLWSGLILALGNSGMLLSASPMAWLMEQAGWRAGYWVAACFGLLTLLLIRLLVPRQTGRAANQSTPARSLLGDARDTIALALSPRLRWLSALAFTNFAAQIGLRGLWGGPWLMEAKGFSRLEAGNALLVFTVALVIGPLVVGMLDRRFGRTGPVYAVGHLLAAAIMVSMVAGGPGGLLSGMAGLPALPGWWDVLMLSSFGIVYGITTLLFPLASAAVEKSQTGQAMAAVNLVNFFGTAVLQTASGAVAERQGPGAAIEFLAAAIVIGAIVYLLSLRNRPVVSGQKP
jgi:predicted MFS family arabinose efflux permease